MLPIHNSAQERRQAVFTQCMLDLDQIDCTKALKGGWDSVTYVRSVICSIMGMPLWDEPCLERASHVLTSTWMKTRKQR